MRTLKAKDIFKKTYSIVNGEVIKNTNGEYYSKQVAEYVLKNSKILNNLELKKIMKLDEDQLNNYAIKYFRNKYSTLLFQQNESENILYIPYKKFEIFTLDTLGGKTFLVEASSLPNGENRDLYYSLKIANKIYERIIDIKDSTFNDYEEVRDIYEREILKIENEISDLKQKDTEIFENDLNIYNTISQTPLYKKYLLLSKDKKNLIEENKKLKKTIIEYNERNKELSEKLKNALERIEFIQKPKTVLEKLENLLKNNEKQILIDNEKRKEVL